MMIFKAFRNDSLFIDAPGHCSALIGIVLLLSAFSVSAEASEKNPVKSDKVSTGFGAFANTTEKNVTEAGSKSDSAAETGRAKANNEHQRDAALVKWELYAEQWELARSGDSILSLPSLNNLVNSWLEDKSKNIEIQYPGGEEGEFWVQELTDWLVSLGIPSNKMFLLVGSGADDMIKFQLIKSEILIY